MTVDSIWVTENRGGTICSVATECPSKDLDSYEKPWIRFNRVSVNRAIFESEAHPIELDGDSSTGVRIDGLMISSDNGKSIVTPGIKTCAMELKPGKKYRVIVEELE